MEVFPETRKKIRILVSQAYYPRREKAVFSCHTPPDSLVSFPPYADTKHQHLRRLHDKAVQAVPVTVTASSQTVLRVPWSRWVATEAPTAAEDQLDSNVMLSRDVVHRVMTSVDEASTVDVLKNDWGELAKKADSPPREGGKRGGVTSRAQQTVAEDLPGGPSGGEARPPPLQEEGPVGGEGRGGERREEEEEEDLLRRMLDDDGTQGTTVDVMKLQSMQRRMVRRIHEKRAAAAAEETPVQRFYRHLQQLAEPGGEEEKMGERAEITPIAGT